MVVYFITDSNITELEGVKEIYWRKNKVGCWTGYADITFFDHINVELLLKTAQFPYTLNEDGRSIYVGSHGMSIITLDDINSKSDRLESLKLYHPVRYRLLFPYKNENIPDNENTPDDDDRISRKRYHNYTSREELGSMWYSSDKLSEILKEQREYNDFQKEMELERWE